MVRTVQGPCRGAPAGAGSESGGRPADDGDGGKQRKVTSLRHQQPPRRQKQLREAMVRLLVGQPQHTDGALTKENLAREAGVSHASVHRAESVLADWDAQVTRPVLRTPGEVQRDETISELRKRLREATSEPPSSRASSTLSPPSPRTCTTRTAGSKRS